MIDIGVKDILCCGDLVGYGPDPSECISFLKRYNFQSVLGNHDKAILTDSLSIYFNEEAVIALNIQKEKMNSDDLHFIKSLPLQIIKNEFVITHSFLDKKRPFKYIIDAESAMENLSFTKKNIIFCGHSHIPGVFVSYENQVEYISGKPGLSFQVDTKSKYVINVGSIGQSRDKNVDLCFALYDTDQKTVKLIRIPYSIAKTQEKMRKLNFPPFLYNRLSLGI
jgi:diadenosine tetraphosphatase ApaH/serine/threonine PP2A family protein phosphatase